MRSALALQVEIEKSASWSTMPSASESIIVRKRSSLSRSACSMRIRPRVAVTRVTSSSATNDANIAIAIDRTTRIGW